MRWRWVLPLVTYLLLGVLLGTLVSMWAPSVQEVSRNLASPAVFSAKALHQHALCGESVELRRHLTQQLTEVKAELLSSREQGRSPDPQVVLQLTRLIHRLDTRAALSQLDSDELDKTFNDKPARQDEEKYVNMDDAADQSDGQTPSEQLLEVCPEIYHGAADDAPLHRAGFVTENCKNVVPLERVITVLLPVSQQSLFGDVERVVAHLLELHAGLPVLLTTSEQGYSYLSDKHDSVTVVEVPAESRVVTPGTLLNRAIRAVETPYVLVARDLTHVTDDLQLERHVRVISRLPMVDVVGGARRNRTGHWRHGCYQTSIAAHGLVYRAGYQHSVLECMLCDYVGSNFAVQTEVLKKLPLDATLSAETAYHDWFLRLRRGSRLAAVCPDIMYFTGGDDRISAAAWRPFAAKWHLSAVTPPGGDTINFRCREVGIRCNPVKTARFYSQPPCCLAQLERALQLVAEMLAAGRVQYELESGALLAAVKLGSHLPWGISTHLAFAADDFWYVAERLQKLRQLGLITEEVTASGRGENASAARRPPPKEKQMSKMLRIHTPHMLISARPERRFSGELLPRELRKRPTLVRLGGVWLRAHTNPGRYARNRYGYDCLKHAAHWRYSGDEFTGEYSRYAAGLWPTCPSHHHACLDQLPVDGSIGVVET